MEKNDQERVRRRGELIENLFEVIKDKAAKLINNDPLIRLALLDFNKSGFAAPELAMVPLAEVTKENLNALVAKVATTVEDHFGTFEGDPETVIAADGLIDPEQVRDTVYEVAYAALEKNLELIEIAERLDKQGISFGITIGQINIHIDKKPLVDECGEVSAALLTDEDLRFLNSPLPQNLMEPDRPGEPPPQGENI